MHIFLCHIGKPRDPHANALAAEYVKRTSRYARCEMSEINPAKTDFWRRHAAATKILLDPAGKGWNSSKFAGLLSKAEHEGCDLVFLVGGHDGLPPGWSERADLLLSLSPMTLPHELARVLLAEQIYRAVATLRGHPYPR